MTQASDLNVSSLQIAPAQNAKVSGKKFEVDKIIGYLLLASGLIIVAVSASFVYRAMSGKMTPPRVFDVESPTITLPTTAVPQVEVPEGFELAKPETSELPPKVKIIPDELLNGVVNISLFYLLMMFMASTGSKVADIGIKMLKDFKVVTKST